MVDNINKNTISEKLARKNLNALSELKNAEMKNKRLISNQTEILKLFDDLLKTISNNNKNNNNNNNSNNNNGNNNENENESESENENDNDNVNDDDNNNNNNNENKNENYDDYEIKRINDYFEMIDESIYLRNKYIYQK